MNGSRARILRGLSAHDGAAPVELVMKSEARKLRDTMADKAGQAFPRPAGGRRQAMKNADDPVAEDRREFIRQVIALLESHRRAGEFDQLAIFAEHEVLGSVRQLLPQPLREMVICEVPKNLLHVSEHDLPIVISGALDRRPDVS